MMVNNYFSEVFSVNWKKESSKSVCTFFDKHVVGKLRDFITSKTKTPKR